MLPSEIADIDDKLFEPSSGGSSACYKVIQSAQSALDILLDDNRDE